METIVLNNKVAMPQEGLGLYQVKGNGRTYDLVSEAIKLGYRMFDTASLYSNEKGLGQAIKDSGIGRQEFFITSKVWIQDLGYEKTFAAFEESLARLGLDYVDLYLIHQPFGDYYGSWRALEKLYEDGRVRAIGVSNFCAPRLLDLILNTKITPAVNQIELHPFFHQEKLLKLMQDYNVKAQAWAPLCEGFNNIFTHPILERIGQQYGKSPGQVALRWNVERGVSIIPKSQYSDHLKENLDIWDFELSGEDKAKIQQLDRGYSEIIDYDNLAVVKSLILYKVCEAEHVIV